MNQQSVFHVTCNKKDVSSVQPGGRIFFLPGSSERARKISERFANLKTFQSPRGHDVHVGSLKFGDQKFDVGTVSTGMGCPSLGIIVNELILLGIKRFLRVGTAGSLAPSLVKAGDSVICTAAVRDEGSSLAYSPLDVPAVASFSMVQALIRSASEQRLRHRIHVGVVHSKDSFHAREFGVGPMKKQNGEYMKLLSRLGILATEMEASHLFSLAMAHSSGHSLEIRGTNVMVRGIQAGCVLAIVGDASPFASERLQSEAVEQAIRIATGSVKFLSPSINK